MERYIGTKLVNMKPMNKAEYCLLRGWNVPSDEDPDEPGYLVEYLDGGTPNHPSFDNYISWSPKEQAEAAYRPTSGMSFGLAIEALKKGFKVCRAGWNGKGMWLAFSRGVEDLPAFSFWSPANTDFALRHGGGCADVLPCITMKTADDKILMGWLASQTDMLADDWQVVE